MKPILFKLFRASIFIIVCLLTLAFLIVAEENWRGKRAWEDYKREAEARGEKLSSAAFIPPPVPDDQNFAMTPLLRPLFPNGREYAGELKKKLDLSILAVNGKKRPSLGNRGVRKPFSLSDWETCLGGGPVLDALKNHDAEMSEISRAVRRPYSRFPLAYEKNFAMPLPHFVVLMDLANLYAVRSEARLSAGETDGALNDIQTIFLLAESLKTEPTMISYLVRIALCQIGLQPVWEGMIAHRWTDKQLAALQGDLARSDFAQGLHRTLHGERTFVNDALLNAIRNPEAFKLLLSMDGSASNFERFVLAIFPSGWIYQNIVAWDRFFETDIFPLADPAPQRRSLDNFEQAYGRFAKSATFIPCKFIAALALSGVRPVMKKGFHAEACADQALIACALERYRLANGQYPETLQKLAPTFLQTIPCDVMTGEPMHYRLNADSSYLLYSIGADGADDGGKIVLKQGGGVDLAHGDWVR